MSSYGNTTGDAAWVTTDYSTSSTYLGGNYNNYTTSTTWIGWNDSAFYWFVDSFGSGSAPTLTPETEEQKQARLVLEAVARETEKLRLEKQKQVEEKALQLLLENLEENQVEIFKKTGCFVITGQSGKKYKINKGRIRNVEELREDGTTEKRMCFHPELYVPDYDTMLSQKLMLEFNEPEARKIANFS